MIARISVILFLLIILPDVYFYFVSLNNKQRRVKLKRALLLSSSAFLLVYTIVLSCTKDFAPNDVSLLNVYLLLLGVFIIPKFVFAVCSFLGWAHCLYHHTKVNYGNYVGAFLSLILIATVLYGCTLGFSKVVVRHETFYSKDLPKSFDGYRIVHISDAHVGTFSGSFINILKKEVDSINLQKADLVAFTGDIQNTKPSELDPAEPYLKLIKGNDGVVSVLGNHDYSMYINASPSVRKAFEQELINREQLMGWRLLNNSNYVIRRGGDSIVIAGMENDGRKPFPQRGDTKSAMKGISPKAFTIMLEHDPTAWRRKILNQTNAQLTLSGHTHAMQFEVFGWSPSSFVYKEWGGMYTENHRSLNVSVGMGGFIPFRIGASNEIVVITLRRAVN